MTIYGVDVASYQGNPDWARVHASGIAFGFSKVSQGTGYVNPTWGHNRAGMLAQPAAGFLPGAYHFLEEGNAVAQVAHFLAAAGDISHMAVGLDIEPATSRPSVATAHAWVTEFHRQRPGHPVLSYFPKWYWQQLGDPSVSFADPIWQSEYVAGSGSPAGLYGRVPSSWWSGFGGAQVALLQFSSSATVPGISGQVDVSAFKGTLGELKALALGHATPTVPPGKPPVKPPTKPPIAPPFPGRVLMDPTQGADVLVWQRQMAARGWRIVPDGKYGPASASVCNSFQTEKHLPVTGKVDKATWAASWTAPVT